MSFIGIVDVSVFAFLLNVGFIGIVIGGVIGIMNFFIRKYSLVFSHIAVVVVQADLCFSVVHFVGLGEAKTLDEFVGL